MIYAVVVDGIIGAGKTLLISKLKRNYELKGFKVYVVREEVDEWKNSGLLDRFYSDQSRWGSFFQMKVFHDKVTTAIKIWEDAIEYSKLPFTKVLIICERWITTDCIFMKMLHDANTVDDLEWKVYNDWWNLWSKVVPFVPKLFIYLRPSLEECMRRVRERNRQGEDKMDIEYQRNLMKEHDNYFRNDTVTINTGINTDIKESISIPVLRIESDNNYRDSEYEFTKLFNIIDPKIRA